MQGNLDPISPYGRAFLGGVQGASPDQVAQRAAEVDKAGLIPFADAIRIKQMADQLSKSGAGMNQPQQGTVLDSLRGQIQSALGPQQMAPQQMPPQDQYAGLRALPVPDDMYADVGMAGGGIVAFSGGGHTIPYEESLLGRLTAPIGGFFSRMAEDAVQRSFQEGRTAQDVIPQIIGGYVPPSTLPYSAPTPSAPPAEPAPSASAKPAPTTSGIVRPPVEGLGGKPFAAPPRAEGLPSLLAPSAAQRPAAPPKLTESSLEKFKKEAEEEYKPLAERFREYDSVLKKRGADIEERAAASSKWLAVMTGFQMAAEASKPGATFLGSAGAAGAEYAKNRIEMNERFADKYDALTDAQFKMATAQAQLEFDKSERAYDRFYKAQDDVYKQQTLLNQVRQLDIEAAANAQRASIYGSNIAIGDIDRALVAAHRQRMQSATDSPEYEQLTSQINQLSELRNTLDPTSGGTNERLTLQARQNLLNNSRYQELLQREQALRVSYANDPQDEEIGNQLEAVIASRIAMETEAKTALENALSGSTDVFGSSGFSANSNVVPYSELE